MLPSAIPVSGMERTVLGRYTPVGCHANGHPARSNPVQAIAGAYQDSGPAADYYPRFHAAVALAQLNNWVPSASRLLVDISGPGSRAAELAAYAGHHVLRVIDEVSPPGDDPPVTPRLATVAADGGGLEFLADGCADGVIAEDRALSLRLAAEHLLTEIRRGLGPGQRGFAGVG